VINNLHFSLKNFSVLSLIPSIMLVEGLCAVVWFVQFGALACPDLYAVIGATASILWLIHI